MKWWLFTFCELYKNRRSFFRITRLFAIVRSVLWRKFNLGNLNNTIDVGSASSGWVVFYRPADLGTGPW